MILRSVPSQVGEHWVSSKDASVQIQSISWSVANKDSRVPAEPPPQKILPSSSMAPSSSTKPDPPPFPSSAAFLPVMWEGAGVEAFCRSRGFTGAGGHARARALEKKLASSVKKKLASSGVKKILQQIWPQTSSWLDLKQKNPRWSNAGLTQIAQRNDFLSKFNICNIYFLVQFFLFHYYECISNLQKKHLLARQRKCTRHVCS